MVNASKKYEGPIEIGVRFGKLVIQEETPERIIGKTGKLRQGRTYKCQCDCGNIKMVTLSDLRWGSTMSCGCHKPKHHSTKDLAGKRFGNLLVLERFKKPDTTALFWRCLCDCGKETTTLTHLLTVGDVKSCGCKSKNQERFDLTDKKFGSLTPIRKVGHTQRGALWECLCDCGNSCVNHSEALRRSKNASCGCQKFKHNKSSNSWRGYGEIPGSYWYKITTRSDRHHTPEMDEKYKVTLTIEDAWELFLAQDRKCALSGVPLEFSRRYKDKGTASLDRKDSSKNYTKENVQWVHKDVNRMKLNYPQEYFIDICKKISEHQGVKDEI